MNGKNYTEKDESAVKKLHIFYLQDCFTALLLSINYKVKNNIFMAALL